MLQYLKEQVGTNDNASEFYSGDVRFDLKEQVGTNDNASEFYSGDVRFETRQGHRLSWLRLT